MVSLFDDFTKLQNDIVSPELADVIREYLLVISKINKLFLSLIQKINAVQNDFSAMLFSTNEIFSKELTQLMKNSKLVSHLQNSSLVHFCIKILDQIKIQGQLIQESSKNINNLIVNPMTQLFISRKIVRQTCYDYLDSYKDQISSKQEDLASRFSLYLEASTKCTKLGKSSIEKDISKMDNAYNTYMLRLSSVNCMNQLLYKHVLPHILFSIRQKENEIQKSFVDYVKYFVTLNKETVNDVATTFDRFRELADNVDMVSDMDNFIKKSKLHENVSESQIPVQDFIPRSVTGKKRASVIVPKSQTAFILNSLTHIDLQNRYLSLQQQTQQLRDSISDINSNVTNSNDSSRLTSNNPDVINIGKALVVCDKEANLKVLLKQIELYTPLVMDFLGPQEQYASNMNVGKIKKKKKKNLKAIKANQKGHIFSLSKVKKSATCSICSKLLPFKSKGLSCKTCKVTIHRDCLKTVTKCDGIVKGKRKISRTNSEESCIDIPIKTSHVEDVIDYDSDDGFESEEFAEEDAESDDDSINYQNAAEAIHISNNDSKLDEFSMETTISDISSASDTSSLSQSLQDYEFVNSKINPYVYEDISIYPQRPAKQKPAVAPKPSFVNSKEIPARKPTVARKPSSGTLNRKLKQPLRAPPAPPPVAERKPKYCVAIYEHKSHDVINLSFIAGQKIKVIKNVDQVWWFGETNDFQGYFPAQYVLLLKENEKPLRCLYNFVAENEKEMCVNENDIIIEISLQNDWVLARTIEKQGYVPSSYVEYI